MSSRSKVQSEKIASTVEKYDLWRSNDSVGLLEVFFVCIMTNQIELWIWQCLVILDSPLSDLYVSNSFTFFTIGP